jgi:phosphoglycolate phosphatase
MKMIVFDLDGTLFDTRQDIANAVNYARRQFKCPELSLQQITKMVGHGITLLTERAFEDSHVDLTTARKTILDYYKLHPTDTARLYSGVRETISKLECIKAIVSNKPKLLVEALLKEHGVRPYFHFVAGGDSFPAKKPDPCAIHFLMEKYQVLPSEILVVGDHEPDIQMAKNAKVQSVFCNYGFFGKDEIGADYEIDSFPELLRILDQIDS